MKKLLVMLLVISLLALPLAGCTKGLTIWEPEDGAIVTRSSVAVRGVVSDPEATVTVNDVEVSVLAKYRSFYYFVDLTEGVNIITVVATFGEATVIKTITVTHRP